MESLYKIQLTVNDNGMPQTSNIATVDIVVGTAFLPLTNEDSDGDLIPDNIEGYQDTDGDGIANYLDRIDACNVLQEEILVNGYLIESQPSACLRLGAFTLGGQSGGAQITNDENNSLWSSQGTPGYCPPPNALKNTLENTSDKTSEKNNIWTLGLNPDHWCVQLISVPYQ